MAAAKKKASKKPKKATKATRKPQKATKPRNAAKAKTKAAKPQDTAVDAPSGFQNPFRPHGAYWACTEALRKLGIGKLHPFAEIVPAVKLAMGENWKAFADKGARSAETGRNAEDRILTNVAVLARKDYGKPLRALRYEVRWNGREKLAGLFEIGGE